MASKSTLVLGMVAAGLATMSASAQQSVYYVTDGTSGQGFTHAWQNGTELYSFQWVNAGEIPIHADGSFLRQAAYPGAGGPGHEYELDGTPTGNENHYTGAQVYDAGFDGQNVYMVDWTSGAVAMYDIDYANRTALFTANGSDLGITFDGSTGTIWTSSWVDGQVRQWDLDGTLLFQFSTGGTNTSALAWDPADDSLWLYNVGVAQFQQYDKSGNLLSTVSSSNYVLGGEMQTGEGGVYFLRASGQCPGEVTISWFGAEPNSLQGLVFGLEQGETRIPQGNPCAGTLLGVAGHTRLVDPPGIFGTGSEGTGSFSRRVGTSVCGGYVQLVHGGSCEVTNVAHLP